MRKARRPYHLFTKPAGALCNFSCDYCYYLEKQRLYPDEGPSSRMPDPILEEYIVQHLRTSPGPVTRFAWHGGEPTLLGLGYFRRIVELQRLHAPPGRSVQNGIQTNGSLLDKEWCRFLSGEGFAVGISLDGPQPLHDTYRRTRGGGPTHDQAIRGYELLRKHGIPCDLLCVVHGQNCGHAAEVYRFFEEIDAPHLTFLPLVERDADGFLTPRSVPAEGFGDFLCTVFDEWTARSIGKTRIQIVEEAAAAALGQEHTLCIFKKRCGDVPVLEHNGDLFSCDHFVDRDHRIGNILETPLVDLIESDRQKAFGRAKWDTLPRCCRACEHLSLCNGGCPKDRFIPSPDGEPGLNYLCAGYKRFFTHCRPFLAELSRVRRLERSASSRGLPEPRVEPGRNAPCPCGSGRKYKKCCMGKDRG